MLEFAVELGFQFLKLRDGELCDVDYKASEQEDDIYDYRLTLAGAWLSLFRGHVVVYSFWCCQLTWCLVRQLLAGLHSNVGNAYTCRRAPLKLLETLASSYLPHTLSHAEISSHSA